MSETQHPEHMPDAERLRALLYGRKVVKAEIRDESPESWTVGPTGYLTLDDGTVLKVWGNDGGCACSAGCYPLTVLNTWDNAITNIEVEERPDGEGGPCHTCGKSYCYEHYEEGSYRIYVVAEDRHLLASFEGSDGNGYYGTGWWLTVERAADSGSSGKDQDA